MDGALPAGGSRRNSYTKVRCCASPRTFHLPLLVYITRSHQRALQLRVQMEQPFTGRPGATPLGPKGESIAMGVEDMVPDL